jgi:hypothetical protein
MMDLSMCSLLSLHDPRAKRADGYAMAALLLAVAAMTVLMTMAMPVWRHAARREKEAELIFRGEQYARAIGLFQRKFPGAFPPTIDVLVEQRFLRKKYKDPMVEDGEFQELRQVTATQPGGVAAPGTPGRGTTGGTRPGASTQPATPGGSSFGGQGGLAGPQGGIIGVASKSTEESIRMYNGRTHYNEWQFVYTPPAAMPGQGGQMPGGRGQRGGAGGRGDPGGMGPGGMGPGGMGPGGRPGGAGPGGRGRGMGPGGRGGFTPAGPTGPIRPPG